MKGTPKNWELCSVEDLMRFEGGSQPPKSTFSSIKLEGYIRLIQIRDYKTDKYLTFIPKNLTRKLCTKDDIMIGRYGPPIFQILKGIEGAHNVALIKVIPNKNIVKQYAWHFLKNPYLFKFIDNLSRRSSGQTGIDMDELKAYPLPLPPKIEQNEIVHILDVWDESIFLLEQLVDEKETQRKGFMQQLLSGKYRFFGFDRLWDKVKLEEIIVPISRSITKPDSRYRILGIRSHFKGTFEKYIDDPKTVAMEELYIAKENDLIVNITFAWEGAIAIVPKEHDGGLVSHRFPMYRAIEEKIDLDFLRYVVIQPRFKYLLGVISPGGAGRNRVLSKKDFLELEILLPEIDEQRRIGQVLRTADKEIELLHQQLEAFKEQKKGLMQQLLTGKKRVKVKDVA